MKGYTLKQDQASEQRETGEKMLNSGVFGGIGADNNSLVDSEVDYKKHTVKDLAKHFALVKPKADIPHAILPEQRIYNGDQGPALNYLGASAQGSSSSTQSFMKKEISQEDFEASKKAYEMKKKQLVFSPDQLKHAKESAAARAAGEADDARPQTAPAAGGAMPFAGLGGLGGQGVPLTLGPQPTGAAANPLGGLGGMGGPENMGKMMQLLQDPEIMAEMKKPKISAALQDVMMNPGNFMKYLQDPEVSPVIMKAMGKLK